MLSRQPLSLRQRLTLVLGSVMIAVLVATVALAYGEVRYSARVAATERLENVAEQLAGLVEVGVRQREAQVDSLAGRSLVRAALRGDRIGAVEEERLAAMLESVRGPADVGLPVQLWSAPGRLEIATGFARGRQPDVVEDPGLDTVTSLGRIGSVAGEMVYWTAIPAHAGGELLGWIVQERRIGNEESAAAIGQLVGSDVAVWLTHVGDSLWVSLSGDGLVAPVKAPAGASFVYRAADGERFGIVAPIEATRWAVVVETPMAAVGARPRTFLARMAILGMILVLAAMFLGWLLGRRLSGPIRELASATDALAAGDLGRRVELTRGDELGRLGRAFNAMADRIATSHDELRTRADELEVANVEAERARREALAASRAKSDFLATMSHEVRTPINAVLGYTDLLRLGVSGPLTAGQTEYLTRIDRSSRLLISLVDDVLDFARIESGELKVEAGSGDAREALDAALAVIEPLADLKGVTLDDRCPPGLRFYGDLRRVQQILLNLASNAVKFTPAGGRVGLACSRVADGPSGSGASGWRGGWVRMDVEDTGIGIPEEYLERVFEPFIQADSGYTRDYGGVGLGLSISRKLATLMGGVVTAESQPEKGSRFTLWLREADPSNAGPGLEAAARTTTA